MARPKIGEKGSEEATRKWRETMLRKYGADGMHQKMCSMGRKGGLKGSEDGVIKGFAQNLTRAKLAGAKGGSKSKVGEKYNYGVSITGEASILAQVGSIVSSVTSAIPTYTLCGNTMFFNIRTTERNVGLICKKLSARGAIVVADKENGDIM